MVEGGNRRRLTSAQRCHTILCFSNCVRRSFNRMYSPYWIRECAEEECAEEMIVKVQNFQTEQSCSVGLRDHSCPSFRSLSTSEPPANSPSHQFDTSRVLGRWGWGEALFLHTGEESCGGKDLVRQIEGRTDHRSMVNKTSEDDVRIQGEEPWGTGKCVA